MTKHTIKLVAASAVLFGLTSPASAEIKLNENFSVSGYLAGSYSAMTPKPGATTDRLNVDSALVLFKADYAPVSAVTSLYYVPNAAPDETTVLDAYATYTKGAVSFTGGKFLSYLGYESFFNVNNNFVSFANGDFLGAIPGYHSGLKFDVSNDAFGFGASIADSEFFTTAIKGDGELRQGAGYEAYIVLKGIPKTTIWAGIAHDVDNPLFVDDITTLNIWGSIALTDTSSLGLEYTDKEGDGAGSASGYNWLASYNTALAGNLSLALRLSGEDIESGPSFTKYSIAPAMALTEKFTVRVEYSYYDYDSFAASSASYVALQGFVKF